MKRSTSIRALRDHHQGTPAGLGPPQWRWTAAALVVGLVVASGCRSGTGGAGLLGGWKKKSPYESAHETEPSWDAWGDRSPDRLILADLAPDQIATTWRVKTARGDDEPAAQAEFDKAVAAYDAALELHQANPDDPTAAQKFDEAATHFRLAAAFWRDSALEHDALFWQGESLYFRHDYVAANRAYEQLIARYAGTRHMDLVQSRRFAIAQYWLELSRHQSDWTLGVAFGDPRRPTRDLAGEARRILHRIRLDDPTGKLADDATLALANAHFEAGNYDDAAETYEDLRRTYPGSQHLFHAHLFELKARLASYRGPSYDGQNLERADKLLRAMVSQFPDESYQQGEYLAQEGVRIRDLLAERHWHMGNYFENRGENRAADFYYAQVVEEYPETKLAQLATERSGELEGKPPVPAQKAEWLAKLFPEGSDAKPLVAPGANETLTR